MMYNQKELENNLEANCGKTYQQCSISVMDTIADPNISFDENGVCNYYYEYLAAEKKQGLKGKDGERKQLEWAKKIKTKPGKQGYNCILGLSGGADSTYLAYIAKKLGLNPLLVHFDYGWNSEIASQNVQRAVEASGFDLYTVVMDWPEFKSLQRSYFKASVLDLDVPADHMIFGALFKTAKKFNIKYVLSGNNVWTEHTLPKSWNYNKFDLVNLKNIHRTFENGSLKHLPALGLWQYAKYQLFHEIELVNFLNWQEFVREDILKVIEQEMNWKNYGGKHQESVFTRFYQGYILPNKFDIDKRKAHLSNLIFSGQMTKKDSLEELSKPTYDERLQQQDFDFVSKKLGFSSDEFRKVLEQPNVNHEFYGTDQKDRMNYFKWMRRIKPITSILKKIR
ncbi:MAG: N-acetyl sugar amidotransferase [Bacteroidia bacterium]|nr:N-acetyl sugar amidotransferase [Bacteroidia bacterium]